MGQVQLANATVLVNNSAVAIIPNSLKFTEGLGEQSVRAASVGGGEIEQIFSDNVESNFAMVSFDIPATVDNIENARQWKGNRNANLVQIQGKTSDGKTLTRTFQQAALLTNYEVALGSDTNITIEFNSNKAV